MFHDLAQPLVKARLVVVGFEVSRGFLELVEWDLSGSGTTLRLLMNSAKKSSRSATLSAVISAG